MKNNPLGKIHNVCRCSRFFPKTVFLQWKILAIYAANFVTIFALIEKFHLSELKGTFLKLTTNQTEYSDVKVTANAPNWYTNRLSCMRHTQCWKPVRNSDQRCWAERLFCWWCGMICRKSSLILRQSYHFANFNHVLLQLVDILISLHKYWVSYRQLTFIIETFELCVKSSAKFDLLFVNIDFTVCIFTEKVNFKVSTAVAVLSLHLLGTIQPICVENAANMSLCRVICSARRRLGADLPTVKQCCLAYGRWKDGTAHLSWKPHRHKQQHFSDRPEAIVDTAFLFGPSRHLAPPFSTSIVPPHTVVAYYSRTKCMVCLHYESPLAASCYGVSAGIWSRVFAQYYCLIIYSWHITAHYCSHFY